MTEYRPPSNRARDLVAGGYDTHVHVAPDVMGSSTDDVETACQFADVGLAGFVLTSHYVPTAVRAELVRKVVPEIGALGAITLNSSVGGLNPTAVEIAGRQGARIVWMPTLDSANQRRTRAKGRSDPHPPPWTALHDDLCDTGMEPPVVDVVDEDGRVLDSTRTILEVIARHHMVLATGRLDAAEIVAIVDASFDAGVETVVVTQADFASQGLSVDVQRKLADRGALLERCFAMPHSDKVTWERLFQEIRQVGPEHSVLSSGLSQPLTPPVEDRLPLMAHHLHVQGFTDHEIQLMAVTNSRRVAGASAP